jgi:hypothetical protein
MTPMTPMTPVTARRWALSLLVVWALAAGAGCEVGDGRGAARGTLFLTDCKKDNQVIKECGTVGDYGSLAQPCGYNLNPRFFAGEPIEDIRRNGSDNRIIIRLQSSGKRLEANDLLTFEVISSYKVARCVANVRVLDDTTYCWWGPDGKGPPRLRVGPEQPIRSNLAPRTTCPFNTFVVGTARSLNATPDQWESWVELLQFGAAHWEHPGTLELIPPQFKVDFNDRIHARAFKLDIIDDRVAKGTLPDAMAEIKAVLGDTTTPGAGMGFFDFVVERGQGAQTFP